MVTIAQSWRKLAQHAQSRGSHAFTHTLTSTQLQPHCVKRQLSYYKVWNQILFEGTRGRGSTLEYPEITPNRLPVNRNAICHNNATQVCTAACPLIKMPPATIMLPMRVQSIFFLRPTSLLHAIVSCDPLVQE